MNLRKLHNFVCLNKNNATKYKRQLASYLHVEHKTRYNNKKKIEKLA